MGATHKNIEEKSVEREEKKTATKVLGGGRDLAGTIMGKGERGGKARLAPWNHRGKKRKKRGVLFPQRTKSTQTK